MTTFINDRKLKCRIVLEDILEKLPLSALQNNNVSIPVNGERSRRQSVRLLRKSRPYMKVAPFRVGKKPSYISSIKQEQLTDAKHSKLPSQEKLTDAKQTKEESFDTTNCDDQLTAALRELSNLNVDNLIGEMKSFIENAEFESFVENGDFDDEVCSSLDATDSNLNCLPLNSEPLSAVLTTPTDFIPSMASVNEIFCLDEIGDLPLDLSINNVKSTGPAWEPKVISYVPLDLSINNGQEWKANIITANAQQIESTSQKFSPNLCAHRNDLIELASSLTIPHTPANTSSACCNSKELVNSSTVIMSKSNKDLNPSANPIIVDSIQQNTPVTKGKHSAIRSKKTKMNGKSKQQKPCQIAIKNNMQNCSENRKNSTFKIPKLKKLSTEENVSKVLDGQGISQSFSKMHSKNQGQLNLSLSQDDSREISAATKKVSTQPQSSTTSSPNSPSTSPSTQTKTFTLNQHGRPMHRDNCPQLKAQLPMPAAIGLLKRQNCFAAMPKIVLRLLDGPCFKFLRNEDCGPYCRYNHLLPSTDIVAATIKNWSNELILRFYLTCVQEHMCFITYFSVMCDIFAERQMIASLLATVEHCERQSNEDYFKSIFEALIHCGIGMDRSMLLLCTNSNRSLASIQVILEIMCSYNFNNFVQTAAFISAQIENYEINPILAVKILENAYAHSPLNTVVRNFCITILRKSLENQTFNQKVMEFFLMKLLT